MRTANLKTPILSLAAAIAVLASPAAGAADDRLRVAYSEALGDTSLRRAAGPTAASMEMEFDGLGRRLRFELEPNSRLTDALAIDVPAGVAVYRGRIADEPGSWARFVVIEGKPSGLYHDGRELYAVETSGNSTDSTPIVYRLADLEIAPGALSCGHRGHSMSAAGLVETMPATSTTESGTVPEKMRAVGAVANLDIGLIADADFSAVHGGGTTPALLARLNIVDGIFSEQLGIQLSVTHIDSFTEANDPFTDETDSSLLLDELGAYRAGSFDQRSAGLTHLFTGRQLDGSNVGIAFGSALCLSQFGAALTATQGSAVTDALIAAHEIGHNFGAPHDNEQGSACSATPGTFLMAPAVNGSDEFSACSITEMQDDIDAALCITALPPNDVEVVPTGLPGSASIGERVTLSFDVRNLGTEQATNVALDVTVPLIATLDSATFTGGGICTSGAGIVSCDIGTLASGAGVTVTIQATGASEGAGSFGAIASASIDTNAGNNASSITLTVGNPPPPPPPADSGGGAPGWPLLLLLAALRLRRIG